MLSILIPVYNRDVTKLIGKLIKQCNREKIFFQVIVIDDCSSKKYKAKNEPIATYFGVNYIELTENIGRAKIRNRLGKLAAYEYALFMDCDMMIPGNFIKTYLSTIREFHPDVICGGIKVATTRPKSIKKQLHWTYGNLRESRNAYFRSKNPILNFSSANFIVKTSCFVKNLFDSSIEGYGYEDVLWAQQIAQNGLNILHIDNPAIHLGIEQTEVYLKKTEEALKNLHSLNKEKKIKETRLLKVYHRLEKYGFLGITKSMLLAKAPSILSNLKGPNPSMRKFDLWKLLTFIETDSSKKTK